MSGARPLRVAIVRPYATLPSEGGSNDRYVNLCDKLLALGASPDFYCSDFVHNAKQRRSPEAIALNAERLPYLRQIASIAYKSNVSFGRIAHEVLFGLKTFGRIMRGPRPDVVLVGEPLFFVGWIALAYGLVFRRPVIADLIDLWPEADIVARGGLSGLLRGAAYSALIFSRELRLHCYRAVSFVSRAYAQRLAPNGATAPVFYWASQLTPRHARAATEEAMTAIYAGSLGQGYDIETVLAAAAILKREGALLRIVIAGDGPKGDLVRRAADEGAITYLGQLSREEMIEAYGRADIGLLPYQAGSMVAMPIKFFDYVNFGLFCASSLAMEAQDIIAEKAIGISYTPGDAADLASKLAALARDPARLERARIACVALAEEFSVDAQYSGFAGFVLDHASPASP